jgi:hypothetical protein
LDPNVGVFHYHSGVTQAYLGKSTEARKELAEALRLEPELYGHKTLRTI